MSTPAVWTKHQTLARGIARDYYLPGADHHDVEQEAMIALWEAARTHDPQLGPFPPYARMIIHRRLRTCVTSALRLKHAILTGSVRVVEIDDQPVVAVEAIAGPHTTEDHVFALDDLRGLLGKLAGLSDLERQAVATLLNGDSVYDSKALNNALQRARAKLKAA